RYAERPEDLPKEQRHQGHERTEERAAQTIVLGPPRADLPDHIGDQPLENRRIRHRCPLRQKSEAGHGPRHRLRVGGATASLTPDSGPRSTSYLRKTSFCELLMLSAASTSSPMSRSTSTPSASPSKLRISRCLRAGSATARRSSVLTL